MRLRSWLPPQVSLVSRADFLGCAQAAVEGGAETVLIVPPLNDDLAARVVNRIWAVATAPALTNRAVMLLLAELRWLIAAAEPSAGVEDRASLDLTLFHNIHNVTERQTE